MSVSVCVCVRVCVCFNPFYRTVKYMYSYCNFMRVMSNVE